MAFLTGSQTSQHSALMLGETQLPLPESQLLLPGRYSEAGGGGGGSAAAAEQCEPAVSSAEWWLVSGASSGAACGRPPAASQTRASSAHDAPLPSPLSAALP